MNERNFSRRRRGGMHFRPSGGLHGHKRQERAAQEARAHATGAKLPTENIYDSAPHLKEIERAENLAAGLPADAAPAPDPAAAPAKRDFREPHLETPAEVQEAPAFQPVEIKNQPQGLVDTIKAAANK